MTAPGNDLIEILLAMAFFIASAYAAGRIHQWYKYCLERDCAYREGYDAASQSMFDAVDKARRRPAVTASGSGGFYSNVARLGESHSRDVTSMAADRHYPSVTGAAAEAVGLSRRRISTKLGRSASFRRRHAA